MRRFTATAVIVLGLLAATCGSASSAASGNNQRWTVVTTPGDPTRVFAQGALNAVGTVVDVLILNPDGTFDNHATQNFPDGTLFYHGAGTYRITVNTRTCRGEGDVVGPFDITGGTGAYTGASGKGLALISLTFMFDRTPTGCAPFPSKVWGVAHATGSLDIQ